MPTRDAARLIGLLVLSCKHVDFSASAAAIRLGAGKALPASKPFSADVPRNPVVLALKFAVMARLEVRRHELNGHRQVCWQRSTFGCQPTLPLIRQHQP